MADCLHENLSELRKSRNYKVHGGADAQVPEPSGSAYFKAFLKTHDDVIAELGKVAYMAGTTAVTGHFVGDMAHIANVGDSRAVLGKTAGDRWRAVEITKDQTGFRAAERERAKNEAHMPIEFLTLGMFYGEEEISEDFGDEDSANAADPPRIFIVGRKFPASAFTRSLGDALGKMAGVCAYPEIHSIKLTQEDTCMIFATDGVWEFIDNQEAMDIAHKHKDSPYKAAKELVELSFERWLGEDEDRTDDITAVVIYFEKEGLSTAKPSMWSKVKDKMIDSKPKNKFAAAVLETLKNVKMKRSRKDLAIQKLFPDYDWSLKNIEGDLGHKFKAETQFS